MGERDRGLLSLGLRPDDGSVLKYLLTCSSLGKMADDTYITIIYCYSD